MKHDYDFVIHAKGRSGTHMLASFLNSHPDISCEGEYNKQDKKINPKPRAKVHGAIFMYNVPAFSWLRPRPKVIHLLRNPEINAVSFIRQQKRLQMRRAGTTEGMPGPEFTLPPDKLKIEADKIRRQQREHKRKVERLHKSIELNYEDMAIDGKAEVMPEDIGKKICLFLGVPYVKMICETPVEFGTKV